MSKSFEWHSNEHASANYETNRKPEDGDRTTPFLLFAAHINQQHNYCATSISIQFQCIFGYSTSIRSSHVSEMANLLRSNMVETAAQTLENHSNVTNVNEFHSV